MPLIDTELIELLLGAATALDEEAAWVVDVGIDDRGVQQPSIPAGDRDYFDVVSEQAQDLRDLVRMIRERRKGR